MFNRMIEQSFNSVFAKERDLSVSILADQLFAEAWAPAEALQLICWPLTNHDSLLNLVQ